MGYNRGFAGWIGFSFVETRGDGTDDDQEGKDDRQSRLNSDQYDSRDCLRRS